MTYEDLLEALSDNKNLSICKNNYLPQFFGDFVIEILYKIGEKAPCNILSDKGLFFMAVFYNHHYL